MLPVSEELSQPHQTARNLRRSLRNAAAGAWLIQAEGLDRKSAADLAASLADALEELHRLQRRLNRVSDATRVIRTSIQVDGLTLID
jgi:hypothetical protein